MYNILCKIKVSLINQLINIFCLATFELFCWLVKDIFFEAIMRNVNEIINQLCADELSQLLEILLTSRVNISNKMNANHKILIREKNIVCPHCGSKHVCKNGTRPNGVQKFICMECHKSFSATTKTVLSSSKKSYELWNEYIKCELNHLTLEQIAAEVGISKTTAFNWRHKLFKALDYFISQIKISGEMQIDATYVSINLKGTKPKNMPRYSKKRTSSSYSGISHHKVCIVSAIDEYDNCVLKIAGLGKETVEYYNQLNPYIKNPTLMITDQFWGFTSFSKFHNCDLEQIPTTSHSSESGYTINSINQIHSEFKTWISKYHGVSIRHLQGYLNMFVFLKYLKYKYEIKERKYQAYLLSIPTNATLNTKDIAHIPLPIDLKTAYGEYKYGIFA